MYRCYKTFVLSDIGFWIFLKDTFCLGFDLTYITLHVLVNHGIALQKYRNTKRQIKYPFFVRKNISRAFKSIFNIFSHQKNVWNLMENWVLMTNKCILELEECLKE